MSIHSDRYLPIFKEAELEEKNQFNNQEVGFFWQSDISSKYAFNSILGGRAASLIALDSIFHELTSNICNHFNDLDIYKYGRELVAERLYAPEARYLLDTMWINNQKKEVQYILKNPAADKLLPVIKYFNLEIPNQTLHAPKFIETKLAYEKYKKDNIPYLHMRDIIFSTYDLNANSVIILGHNIIFTEEFVHFATFRTLAYTDRQKAWFKELPLHENELYTTSLANKMFRAWITHMTIVAARYWKYATQHPFVKFTDKESLDLTKQVLTIAKTNNMLKICSNEEMAARSASGVEFTNTGYVSHEMLQFFGVS